MPAPGVIGIVAIFGIIVFIVIPVLGVSYGIYRIIKWIKKKWVERHQNLQT